MNKYLMQSFLFLCAIASVAPSSITLSEDGGYRRILVALSPRLSSLEIKFLLPKLEELFSVASQFLHLATYNQFYFQEVVFLLPKTASDLALPDGVITITERKYSSPNIIITGEEIFGRNPFTIQHSGCQEEGLYIKLPTSFLKDNSQDLAQKAKILIHEWAHFRYGVFDEHGFPGDVLYPLYYRVPGQSDKEPISITSCTNDDVFYKWQNNSGAQCLPGLDGCFPVPDKGKNNIFSSLLYDPVLPNVNYFCDDKIYKHNRNTPTKQNALCKEESTWKVISKHQDFNSKRETRMPNTIAPSFKYVKESDVKLVLIFESTENMIENDKMDIIRNAFAYFVLYDLPVNSRVGIINSKLTSLKRDPFFITVKSTNDRERILDAFPDAYGKEDHCIQCGIFKALKVLNSEEKSTTSGTLVLVTTVDISPSWIENVTMTLKFHDVRLFVIFLSVFNEQQLLLESLTEATGGRLFYVPETTKNPENLVPLTILYETFRSIHNSIIWTSSNDIQVSYQAFNDKMIKETMSFVIDENIENFHLLLTGPNFISGPPVLKDKVLLWFENTTYQAGHPSFSNKKIVPAFVFNIKKPKAGIWHFSFERKTNFISPLVVIIRAATQSHAITVKPIVKFLHDNKQPPAIIYAEVKKGELSISNAKVSAIILHPDSEKISRLELYDGGEGDPDTTRNDGIYSRYFTEFSTPGYYIVAVIVHNDSPHEAKIISDSGINNKCCGSVIPEGNSTFSNSFTRSAIFGSFYFVNKGIKFAYSPRRITDLHITTVLELRNNVKHYTLQWTAPGENYDTGKAERYELKVFKSRNDVLNDFENAQVLTIDEWKTHGPFLQPKAAGTIQSTTIELRNITTGSYFISIRAVNALGNRGSPSNIVEIYFTTPSSVTAVVPDGSDFELAFTSTEINNNNGVLTSDLGIVIGTACGILFLLFVIGCILFIYYAKYHTLQEKKNANLNNAPFNFGNDKTVSNDTLCHSISSVSKEEENISIISPISSWSAGALLSHYEKVQVSKCNNEKPLELANGGDNVSQVSTLNLDVSNAANQFSSEYDSLYIDNATFLNSINPSFNPAYTSSLRRFHGGERPTYKLGTDV